MTQANARSQASAPDAAANPTANPAISPVDAAIIGRQSIRAFQDRPVPREEIEAILEVASHAPSGSNIQPWRVYVLTGPARQRLTDAILAAYDAGDAGHKRTWKYYPDEFFEPYKGRRRACGWGLYGTLGIERGETERMKAQRAENYRFFGAPVGLIFTIDERLEIGSWMDVGMFLQSIMISARGRGLDTCPQAAFGDYHRIIREQLGVPANETIICGMSLGYREPNALVNTFRPEREPVSNFARFIDQ